MSETPEIKSERITLAVTPTELEALVFLQMTHGDRYDGNSSVVRDYSLTEAVAFRRRALSAAGAVAA